jgi:ankyrin repeat protein
MRPVVAALAGEHFQTADLLHRNGADLHVRGRNGSTPLHSAAYFGDLEVIQKLIEYDADVNAEDENGDTPLHLASIGHYFKDGSALRLLLEHGADINAWTTCGWTPVTLGLAQWGAGGSTPVARAWC